MPKQTRKPRILLNACMYTSKPNGNGIYIKEAYNRICKKFEVENIEYTCYAYYAGNLLNEHNVELIKIPFSSKNSFNRLLGVHRIFWNCFILPFIARKYDMVYSFSNHGGPFIKNQIITIHDLICMQFPKQNRLQYFYNKYVLPYIIKSCKKVVAISEYTKGEVLKYFGTSFSKVSVIYNGGDHLGRSAASIPITVKKYLAEITGGKNFYLSVGATYPHKNMQPLIQAMQQINNDHVLIITGQQNKYFEQLKTLIKDLNASNVILLDYVDNVLLSYLYSKCAANIYISLNEGFGFPPMEAMYYNKISVISNKGALPEIYGDGAYYADPYNVDEIKNAMQFVVSPQFTAEDYKKKYRNLLTTYTWDATATKIASLIASCLPVHIPLVEKAPLGKIKKFG